MKISDCKQVIDFRIDANTYKKDYLESDILIRSKNPKNIEGISVSVQNFGAYSLCNFINYVKEGIPFLMTENIRHNFIDWDVKKYVDEQSHKMLYKSHCSKGQVLVTMAGEYLGRVAVYNKDFICSSNQAIAKISLKQSINPYIVSTFLNSKHGQNQINRFKTITGQPNINMSLIKNLLIPSFTEEVKTSIQGLIKKSDAHRANSKYSYEKAKNLLLQELGLENFQPSREKTNVKSLKDSFLQTGRLDAEYYMPKYERLIDYITKNLKWENLENLTTYISNGNQPPYTETGDIKFFSQKWIKDKFIDYAFLKSDEEPMVDSSFFNDEKNKPSLVGKGDILYYSVGANLGYCHNYMEDEQIAVGSFINIIRADSTIINEIYLGVVLNSIIGRLQGDREKSGIAQPYIYAKNLRKFIVPIIEESKQQETADLIEESFALKKRSEHLLEVAKRAVEIAIEQNENAAIAFIKKSTTDS